MKLSQILKQDTVTVSCELFPPKAGAELDRVEHILSETARLNPEFISVTYGAGGSTSKRTLELVTRLQNQYHVPSIAHLTCVSSSQEKIASMIQEFRANKVENILALRGDIPHGVEFPNPRHYLHASDLIADIRSMEGGADFCIGAACYPEGHVECRTREEDIDHLKRKVDAGVDFLTTQMFFDNSVMYHYMYRLLAKGIQVPVVAGIMPMTNGNQIKRSCELSGAVLPPRFKGIIDRFGDDPAAMKQAGIAYATEQIIDLIANGVSHIHIYTMNKPDIAEKIMNNLSDIIKKPQ
jgi:methylenetetrahydrofolate reductase (NADPH)